MVYDKQNKLRDALQHRNTLSRKIQSRHGRIEILKQEILALQGERDDVNLMLPALEKSAQKERWGNAGIA